MPQSILQQFKALFLSRATYHGEISHEHWEFELPRESLPEAAAFLLEKSGCRLLTTVGSDGRSTAGVFYLFYLFGSDATGELVTLKLPIPQEDPVFPSLSGQFPVFNWHEREIFDLFGLRPTGHPDLRPLALHGDWPAAEFPLRKDFAAALPIPREKSRERFMPYHGQEVVEIPVGPIHAGIIEPGHFRFGVIGDTVLHLDARLFYTHRGLEKAAEGKSPLHALFLAERICGMCALTHALSFAQAVEGICQHPITPRAAFLRTILLELERLYNHIGDIGNLCAGFGYALGVSHGGRLREELLRLNERLTGHRYLRGTISLGGVRVDLTEQDSADLLNTIAGVEKDFTELSRIIMTNDIAIDRMKGTGILSAKHARAFGAVGVAARASGLDIDLRRDLPFAAYGHLKFSVPVENGGDVLARAQIRLAEVTQSFSIIRQAVAALPPGPLLTGPLDYRAGHGPGWAESSKGETIHWVELGPDGRVLRYRVRSATYSNWPVVPLAVPGDIIPDFPLINKSFELCYSCCDR